MDLRFLLSCDNGQKTPLNLPLTHFISLVSFYTHWRHQKIKSFFMPLGDIERDSRREMA